MRALWLILGAWLCCSPAWGHQLATAMLSLEPLGPGQGQWQMQAQIPELGRGPTPRLQVSLGPNCSQQGPTRASSVAGRGHRVWVFACADQARPQWVRVEGLSPQLPDALLQVQLPGIGQQFHGLNRQQPQAQLPQAPVPPAVGAYFSQGLEHIAGGWDHLLFVLLLFWCCQGWGLIAALTGFTAAHACSLTAVLIGGLRLPSLPVEVLIAASLSLLAAELLRVRAGASPSLALRRPGLMAFAFGLLHGLGFAGALMEIGLPPEARWQALLLFNLGIEAGQLLLVLGLWALLALARGLEPWAQAPMQSLRRGLPPLAQYGIGITGVVWSLDRLQGLML